MRPVDACLESLESLPEPARRLRLRRLGDLAPTPDAPEILARLGALRGGPCDVAARLAGARWRLEADRDWIRRVGGDPVPTPPAGDLGWPLAPTSSDPADAELLWATAAEELDALIPALGALAAAPGAVGSGALEALASLGTPRAAEAVSALELDAPRRLAALVTHGGSSNGAPAEAYLEEVPVLERAALLPFFASLPGGAPPAELDRALDGGEVARQAAAHALEGSPLEVALPRLRTCLRDADPWTRLQAVETLGILAPPELPELLPLGDPEAAVRAAAIRAAARGGRSPEGILAAALEDPDPRVRATAWRAWCTRVGGHEGAADQHEAALADPDPRVVEAAGLACARGAPELAARVAQRLIDTGDAAHVLAAIEILPTLDDPGATTALQRLYSEATAPRLRREVLRALGRRAARFPEALFGLQDALGDPGSRVEAARALALAHPVGRQEALATLTQVIDREEDDDRAVAMTRSLALAGPAEKPIQRLLGNLGESGGELALAASWCRAWVDPEATPATPTPVDPVLRGLDLELAWTAGHGSLGDLPALLESASSLARHHLVDLARELAAVARFVGTASRLAPLARRLRLKDALRCPLPARTETSASTSQADYLDWQSARREMGRRLQRRRALVRPRPPPFRPRRITPALELPDGLAARLGQEALEAALSVPDALAGIVAVPARAPPGLVGSLLAAAAGVLLAVGLRGALRPASPSSPPPAEAGTASHTTRPSTPPPAGRARAGGPAPRAGKATLDEQIERLAVTAGVQPTGACPVFDQRWMQLREWLMAELSEGPTLCTYTQLMQLRARHLSGDEGAHEELDGYLRGASGLLAERILQEAAGR